MATRVFRERVLRFPEGFGIFDFEVERVVVGLLRLCSGCSERRSHFWFDKECGGGRKYCRVSEFPAYVWL